MNMRTAFFHSGFTNLSLPADCVCVGSGNEFTCKHSWFQSPFELGEALTPETPLEKAFYTLLTVGSCAWNRRLLEET